MTGRSVTTALALMLAATPAALAHGGGHGHGSAHGKGGGGDARGAPPVAYVVQGCVTADAAEGAVPVTVRAANRHARRALAGGTTLTVTVGDATRVERTGRHRAVAGSAADLRAGDRVTVWLRAPQGAAAADLPAASRVRDRGPGAGCAPPPPADDTSAPGTGTDAGATP